MWEGLWKARFTIILLLVAATVIIFASIDGFDVAGVSLRPTGPVWRGVVMAFGVSLLAVAVVMEFRRSRDEAGRGGTVGGTIQPSHFLIDSNQEVLKRSKDIVTNAKQFLVTSGSRSRDEEYLHEIEQVLHSNPELIHFRVLVGPPHHPLLKEHLQRLVTLRADTDRTRGQRTLHLGLCDGPKRPSEAFICANEKEGIVILPSMTGVTAYDTALVLRDKRWVDGLNNHVRQLYAGSKKLEDRAAIDALPLLS